MGGSITNQRTFVTELSRLLGAGRSALLSTETRGSSQVCVECRVPFAIQLTKDLLDVL